MIDAAYRPTSLVEDMIAEEFAPETDCLLEFPFDDGHGLVIETEADLDNRLREWASDPAGFITACIRYPLSSGDSAGDAAATGGVRPLTLTDYHREALDLVVDPRATMLLICWPKRHGKTMLNAALGCWRAATQRYQGIAVLATSREHAETTLYGYEYAMFRHSPFLRWLAGGETNLHERAGIYVAHTESAIRPMPCRVASVSGRPFSMLQVTELREMADETVFHMAASQTEQRGAITVVDSSASEPDNIVTELHDSANGDASGFREHYMSGTCAPWISDAWLADRRRALPATLFTLWHINEFGDGAGRYFTDAMIRDMHCDWPDDMTELTLLRKLRELGAPGYVACAGLDRSAPWTEAGQSDRTSWTVTVRFTLPETVGAWQAGDHYAVVRQVVFKLRDMETIKRQVARDAQEFRLAQTVFEQYQCGDLYLWALGRGINARLSHARGQEQMTMFSIYHALGEQRRLHAPAASKLLWQDMRDFDCKVDGDRVQFGASKKRKKKKRGRTPRDDTVYSTGLSLLAFQFINLDDYGTPGIIGLTDAEWAEVAA